jgi:hypothetical protein
MWISICAFPSHKGDIILTPCDQIVTLARYAAGSVAIASLTRATVM